MLIAGGTAIVLATLVAEAALVASFPPIAGQSQGVLKGALAMIYLYIVSYASHEASLKISNLVTGFRGISPRRHSIYLL